MCLLWGFTAKVVGHYRLSALGQARVAANHHEGIIPVASVLRSDSS